MLESKISQKLLDKIGIDVDENSNNECEHVGVDSLLFHLLCICLLSCFSENNQYSLYKLWICKNQFNLCLAFYCYAALLVVRGLILYDSAVLVK